MNHSDVRMIFGDLTNAFEELKQSIQSPKSVRRTFSLFVELSQKLTSTMRKEYSSTTGDKWEASKYMGWNNVTELFKKLRNTDQHDWPIVIVVHERQYFRIDESSNGHLVNEGTWELSDQLSDLPPSGAKLFLVDPKTGLTSDIEINPAKIEYEFLLHPRTDEKKELLKRANTNNVHVLSAECFAVLQNYYDYYQQRLTAQQKNRGDRE